MVWLHVIEKLCLIVFSRYTIASRKQSHKNVYWKWIWDLIVENIPYRTCSDWLILSKMYILQTCNVTMSTWKWKTFFSVYLKGNLTLPWVIIINPSCKSNTEALRGVTYHVTCSKAHLRLCYCRSSRNHCIANLRCKHVILVAEFLSEC